MGKLFAVLFLLLCGGSALGQVFGPGNGVPGANVFGPGYCVNATTANFFGPVCATWNPLTANSDFTLTVSNYVATHTGAVSEDGIVASNIFQPPGQYTVTFLMGNVTSGHTEVGFISSGTLVAIGNFLGQTANSLGIKTNGQILINNVGVGNTGLTFTTGNLIDVAIDSVGKLLWVRVNGGNWNNSSANSPGGSGGISISALSTFTLSPGADVYSTGDSVTGYFSNNLGYTGFLAW